MPTSSAFAALPPLPDIGQAAAGAVLAEVGAFLALTLQLALEAAALLALAWVLGVLLARHTTVLARLDATGLPQRFVHWLGQGRKRQPGAGSSSHGVTAVTLAVTHPTLPAAHVRSNHLPQRFGAWRDFELRACCQGTSQVAAILKDPGSGVELTLVMPRHQGFALAKLRRARKVRLTMEAPRSRVLTVRTLSGELLAAGALDPHNDVTLSQEVS